MNGANRIWDYEHGRWTDRCVGPMHIWLCPHAESCQCGGETREIVKCEVCGK